MVSTMKQQIPIPIEEKDSLRQITIALLGELISCLETNNDNKRHIHEIAMSNLISVLTNRERLLISRTLTQLVLGNNLKPIIPIKMYWVQKPLGNGVCGEELDMSKFINIDDFEAELSVT